MQQSETLLWLEKRGLPLEAVMRYKLGWISEYRQYDGSIWGLDKTVVIPAGLLIPMLGKDGQPRRLKIRCKNWHPDSNSAKYIAVSGSMSGLNIVGNECLKNVVIVESELDAYAIHHIIGDIVCVIAIGGSTKKLDPTSEYIAQTAHTLLICHDNDAAGNRVLQKWRLINRNAQAYPTPIGKDIGEAVALGLNIREFFVAAIMPPKIEVPQPIVVHSESTQSAITTTPLIIASSTSEIGAIEQKQFMAHNDLTVNMLPPEIASHVEENPTLDLHTETLLNSSQLIIWATAYFEGIPDAYKLPSDKRLYREIKSLNENVVPESLQKELLWIHQLTTGDIV